MRDKAGYAEVIRAHEAERNARHAAVHASFAERDRSPAHREVWVRAAQAFREHRTPVDALCERALAEGLESDPELRRFAFEYLACDPYYFRSGYFVETLLRRVKRLRLGEVEREVLRRLILQRIDRRALRNFRDLCRMIPLIDNAAFREAVAARCASHDAGKARRAAIAMARFPG